MFSNRAERPPAESPSDHFRRWSLANRLMAWYAVSAFAIVLGVTAFLQWGLARGLGYWNDHVLLDRIYVLRALLRHGEAKHAVLRWEIETEREEFEDPRIYLRVLDKRLNPIIETPGMARFLAAGAFPAAADSDAPGQGVQVRGQSGRVFRVMAATATREGERCTIQAAFDLTSQQIVLSKYRSLLVFVLAASALASLGIGYRITRAGMRPLADIVQTTRRIRSSTLGERVELANLPAELASLATNFNDMLDRLEESFQRLSRFSADIAHELRTPLGNIRGEAEVALSRGRSAEEYREVLVSSLEECAHLSRIVDSLLFIALAERSEAALDRERTDLAEELRSLAEFFEPIAAEKRLNFVLQSNGKLWIDLDRGLFRRAVSNLVSNAVAYTSEGGTVALHAVRHGAGIRVEVSDTGIGIAPEHLPHVFDRFYRVEQARPKNSGRAGLGLSIAKTIVDLHGGSVEIVSEPGRGTCVALIFPQMARS